MSIEQDLHSQFDAVIQVLITKAQKAAEEEAIKTLKNLNQIIDQIIVNSNIANLSAKNMKDVSDETKKVIKSTEPFVKELSDLRAIKESINQMLSSIERKHQESLSTTQESIRNEFNNASQNLKKQISEATTIQSELVLKSDVKIDLLVKIAFFSASISFLTFIIVVFFKN